MLVASHGPLRQAAQCLGKLEGPRQRLALGHDLVGQTHAKRLFRADGSTGEDEVHRVSHADDPREALRASVDERYVPATAGHAELSVLLHDAQVPEARELEASRQGVAVDGAQDRLVDVDLPRVAEVARPVRHELAQRGRRGVARRAERLDGAEVRARREGVFARPREDGDPEVLVVAEANPCIMQELRRLAVHAVAHLRAVDGDEEDVLPNLRLDLAHLGRE